MCNIQMVVACSGRHRFPQLLLVEPTKRQHHVQRHKSRQVLPCMEQGDEAHASVIAGQ